MLAVQSVFSEVVPEVVGVGGVTVAPGFAGGVSVQLASKRARADTMSIRIRNELEKYRIIKVKKYFSPIDVYFSVFLIFASPIRLALFIKFVIIHYLWFIFLSYMRYWCPLPFHRILWVFGRKSSRSIIFWAQRSVFLPYLRYHSEPYHGVWDIW